MKLEAIGGAQNDGLYRDPKSGKIYVRKYREGKGEILKSTRTVILTDARIIRDKLFAELWGEKPMRKQPRQTVGELWAKWEEGCSVNAADATMKSIRSSWKNLAPYIDNTFLDDVTLDWWLTEYIPKKRKEISPKFKRPNPKRKFENDWKWLSTFLKWCQETDKYEPGQKRPMLINPDPKRDKGRALSDGEVRRLIENSSGTLKLQILMAVTMGMRASEIAKLAKNRIDWGEQTIFLRAEDTKIRQPRPVPISSTVLPLLELQCASSKSPFVFPAKNDSSKSFTRDSKSTAWDTCRAKANVDCKFHELRHTFLTKAFKTPGSNAAKICHFAGLSLKEAQETYLHLDHNDVREVAELVRY